MKYYIYSPIGRTGSTRLVYLLGPNRPRPADLELNTHYDGVSKRYIVNQTAKFSDKDNTITFLERYPWGDIFDGNKVLEHVPVIFPKKYEHIPNGCVIHSHTCMWPTSENWVIILSSRKNKTEMPMSLAIAAVTGYWHAKDEPDRPPGLSTELSYFNSKDEPFTLRSDWYYLQLKQYEARERAFLKGVKENTGKEAVIVYQEDTVEEIDAKIGPLHPSSNLINNGLKLSARRPKDFIINYEELKEIHDDFEKNKKYHMSIPFHDF
jgi:hypothetical protein